MKLRFFIEMNDPNEGIETNKTVLLSPLKLNIEMNDPNEGIETRGRVSKSFIKTYNL